MLPFFLPVLCPISTYVSLPAFCRRLRLAAKYLALVAMVGGVWNAGRAQQPLQILQHHVRPAVSGGQAALVGSLPATKHMNLSIVMPLRNQDELTSLLSRLYDPSSPDYHKFLSVKQFTEQFGPTVEDYWAVLEFARANGFSVSDRPSNRLVVPISGSVAQINKAFHVQMNIYQDPTQKRTFFSPDREPSLDLSVPVMHVAGMNNFSVPKPAVLKPSAAQAIADVTGSGPGGSYLGSDMRAAYYGGTTLTGNGQAVGVFEFYGYYMSDVNSTFSNAGQTYSVPVNNVLLDGATGAPSGDDGEQVLDIVQAIGMAPGLSQVRVYIGNPVDGLDDANIFNAMATENIAKQIGVSWGWYPDDPTTDDVFFEEFAAQGQSLFVASGDDGAFDASISPYFYPAEDVYVTAVGGTHLTTTGAAGSWVSETAWNSDGRGSGGGISPDGIAIPSWQTGAINSSNGGSSTVRNEPDVAMEGDFDNYDCDMGECEGGWAGTSFAAPRWAGFMALVNQQAVEAGNAPQGGIGFINPAIYTIAEGSKYNSDFHDITSGNNDTQNQPEWYIAVTGYDLVTGWGSANGQNLINDLAGPQVPGFWLESSSGVVNVSPGGSGTTIITVTDAGGFTGNVTLEVTSALPSGVTASWGTNPTSGTSVLTLTASSSAPQGTASLTITGTSGDLTETTTLTVSVNVPTFVLSASPSGLTVDQGSYNTSLISVNPKYGFTGSVNLAVSGLPTGVTATWGTNPTSGTSLLTFTASSSAPAETATVTVTGTSGSLTVTTTIALTVVVPTFTLGNSGNVSIGQSSTAGTYIYIYDQNGFNGSVNMAVSGLPAGVTASFSPNPATANSYLYLTASSTATTGTYTLTVTGTSGSITATTTFTLTVYAPSFTLSGGNVSIGQGSSGESVIYIYDQYGFNGNVNLALSGLPAGVTASFTPNPATSYSYLTLTANSSATPGTYTLTVTGTSGSLSATTTLTLAVYAPSFTLSANSVNIGQGTATTTYVYVNDQYGFTGNVNLAVSGLPAGVTASFSPNPASYYSMLTLTASNSASIGSYTVTITGTSGSLSATTTMTLGVYAPGFTLSSSGSTSVGQGSTSTTYIYMYPQYGFNGNVSLTTSGLPSGATASFSPNPTSSTMTTMTIAASSSTALGSYNLTITGTAGPLKATTSLTLVVDAQSFTIYDSPNSVSLLQGNSNTTNVYVTAQNGFNGNVSFAISGMPSGVTADFAPNPTSTGASVLMLMSSSTTPAGTYPLTITGTSGSLTATTTLSLTIDAPTFALSDLPGDLVIDQGNSANSSITVIPAYGFGGSVSLAASGLPSGVSASWGTNPATGSSLLTVTASSTATPGKTTATITGTSGSLTATTPLTVTVRTVAAATTTTLAVTSAGSPVTSISSGSAVTLTATVVAGSTAVTAGQVNFCDATAAYCEDIHILGSAQLTGAGTAVMKFIPGIGSHSYSAVFVGTSSNGISTSSASALQVTGNYASTSTIAQSGVAGNYTLTATVAGQGPAAPTGTVSFLDTTSGNSVLGTASLSGGQEALSWLNPQSPVTSSYPWGIAAGDFNGDGIPDLAVANYYGNSVTILLGKGDGTFSVSTKTLPTGNDPYYIVVADFNGDGKPDLAVTNFGSNTVTILLGNGDGTFTAAASVATGGGPNGIAVGDFNGDGIPDLAIANGNSNTVTILLGKGDGTFTPAASPATGAWPKAIVAADFNGDGIPDLAVTNENSSTVTVLLGVGDGTFTPAASPQTGESPYAIAVADFNGDGKPDLAVVNNYGESLTILLGNGDGTFTESWENPETGSCPTSVAAGDFNGDSIVDLAVVNNCSNTVTVLLGNGDGTFTTSAVSPATGTDPANIALADFNGDGKPDLAVTNYEGNSLTILTTQSTQTATATATGISPAGSGIHLVDASYPGDSNYNSSVSTTTGLTASGPPAAPLTWATPAAITYGTTLSATQLDATSTVAGTYVYTPPAGTLLGAGQQPLSVLFTPNDTTDYSPVTATVTLTVNQVTPAITWATPAAIVYGTPLSSTQLDASSTVAGSFTYTPAVGTVLAAGNQTLSTLFTPTDKTDYTTATATVTLTVNPPSGWNFGSINVGTPSATATLNFTITAGGTIQVPAVLTQGAPKMDYADAGTGTCTTNGTGYNYSPGATCSMNVIFTPSLAGPRNGAVVLQNSSGNVIATGYLQGTGLGPQINFLPNAESTVETSGMSNAFGVAVDGNGNVYIADTINNRILKETFSGGSYIQSIVPTSSLSNPYYLAVDAGGNIYISDTYHHRALKETPSTSGYSESIIAVLSSSYNQPVGITVDGYGNVYLTDGLSTLYIETWTGSGYTQSTISISTSDLTGIAVDGSGNIYVGDIENKRVLKETPSAGGYIQSTLPTSGIVAPWGIAVDGSGGVYITDTSTYKVFKETPSAGSYTQSTLTTSTLNYPMGVAVDGSGNVYIADTDNSRILKEDFVDPPSLSFASTAVGSTSSDSPQTVTIENTGNATLNIPVPSTGNNPSITANFSLNSSGTSACPLVASGSSTPGTLAAGASCQLPISFAPGVVGTLSGSLALKDSNLNAPAPGYTTQTIKLSGTATHGAPPITWATPAAISYGTPLSATQLDASSTVAGTYVYSPVAGTVLGAGKQTLKVTFTPTDSTDYSPSTATVTLTVNQATPAITWATPAAITYGTALSASQLDATSKVAGSFIYSPASGTVLGAGKQTLKTTFTPADSTDYTTATDTVTLTVNQATPAIAWATPAAILYGTPLGATQLDASSPVAGSFTYSPAAGTVLAIGTQTLSALFTPTDTVDYTTATATVSLIVGTSNWKFGTVNIGSPSTTIRLYFTVTSGGTIGVPAVLTQGSAGLDYADAGTGSCTKNGISYNYGAGAICSVDVIFTPKWAGTRYGAVVIRNSGGNVIATGYLQGVGAGPQVNFLPNSESTVASLSSGGLINPDSVAVDGSGNVYIADTGNARILKETLSAGSYTQSTIPTSSLNSPGGIALDGAGNIYISDTNNYRILKETPSASGYTESTVAGFTPYQVEAVAVDVSGNVYVISGNNLYLETLSGGSYTQTFILDSTDSIFGIAVDGNGNIYLPDSTDSLILKETPSANGGYTQSTVPTTGLNYPSAVAVDASGSIYIVDTGNERIVKETLSGSSYTQSIISTSSLDRPGGLAVDGGGNVYIAGGGNFVVLKEDFTDPPSLGFASTAVGSTSSDSPKAVTVENTGSSVLTFPVPASGNNPSVAANFSLNSSGTSACPLIASGSSAPGTLAAGASCQLPISFAPGVVGALSGSLVVTDNNLNAAAPAYATQSIKLSGTATHGTPPITWATPAAITYGTPLSATQLDASATVAGTYAYSPAAGTVLGTGQQTLKVTFTPTDTVDYTTATDSVALTVNRATPTLTVTPSSYQITTAQALTVTIGVSGGAGRQTATGSVILSSGSYTSLATPLSSGSATLTIPAGSLAAGSDTLTASYTPDSNSSPTYNSATGTSSAVTVTAGVASTPTFMPAAGAYTSAQSVTISDATAGATIYYTTNGTAPTTASTKYTAAVTVSSTQTLEAIATASGYANSAVASSAYTISLLVATPTFSPAAGTYTSAQTVTISDATAGAAIYYTTNGTAPTTASTKYSAAIAVSTTETLEAIATASGSASSTVATAKYTITPSVATPTFSPAAGTYSSAQSVTITDATTGATIYYTTSGVAPTTASTKYTAAVTVSSTETLEAIAVESDYANSTVATAPYTIGAATATPTFTPAAGAYTTKQSVTITDATTGAIIYYTTNGTTPTTASATYTSAFSVPSNETLEAMATAAGHLNSSVATAKYTLTPTVATPTFSPAAGTYPGAQTVTISDATGGSTIYYTTNGTAPTTGSTKYTAAITVSSTKTLQAIAAFAGYTTSSVATAPYTITHAASGALLQSGGRHLHNSANSYAKRFNGGRYHLLHHQQYCAYDRVHPILGAHQRQHHGDYRSHRRGFRVHKQYSRIRNLYD